MRKYLLHILCLVLLALSCQGPRVIPKDDMALVMREMLLQDQQVRSNLIPRARLDTVLVYEGIFEKYGYDTDDFLYSLEYYLAEPERMEKVMEETAGGLEKEAASMRETLQLQQWQQKLLRIYGMQPDTTAPRPRVRAADTLKVRFQEDSVYFHKELDSLSLVPRDSLLYVNR